MALVGTAQGTAVGVSTDMATGLIDRFRSLPIARSSVLAGRVVSRPPHRGHRYSPCSSSPASPSGWGIHNGVGDALTAFGLCLLISFAMTWVGACAGMLVKNPEAARRSPSSSSSPWYSSPTPSSPPRACPAWLRDVADWNPVSAVASSCRNLFGNPNPSSTIPAWPMQHPELATVLWSIGLIAVFAPLAVHFYRRKSLQ